MAEEHSNLWNSDAEAQLLESRLAGFWNPDYFSRIILPLLDLKPGTKVLDVGAGNGSLTLLFAQALPEVHFLGVDITPNMVTDGQALAEKLGIKNIEFKVADALSLPFEDATFDATICQTLLIHLSNPGQAVQEMSRVLKPGGAFLAAEYHTLNAELPIVPENADIIDEQAFEIAKYTQMLIKGYRQSGQGDLKAGGRVPFLALNAGLEILDIRINDRVAHAFPPYRKPSEKAAILEAQSWLKVFQDESYQTWLTGAMVAGGGTENDAAEFLKILNKQQDAFTRLSEDTFAFLWLMNPVLLITIARKR